MSPRSGIFVSVRATRLRIEAADDDRLLILDDELRLRRALRERDGAERADGCWPSTSLISSVTSRRTSSESLRCGMILTLVPMSWRGAAPPPKPPSPPSAPSAPAAPAARRPGPARPPKPPTFVCSGMFWPTLISAGMLSVARMCGVERMSASLVLRERVDEDAERRDRDAGAEEVLACPGCPGRGRRARTR